MKNQIFKPNTETSKTRQLTVTAMMGAMAAVLQFLEFPVPMFMPSFIKFDLSELPALTGQLGRTHVPLRLPPLPRGLLAARRRTPALLFEGS